MFTTQTRRIDPYPLPRTRQPLHVLECCFSDSLGGLELYMQEIATYLAERGHRVIAVAPPGSPLAQRLETSDIPFFAIPNRVRYLDILAAWRLAQLMRQFHIDIVHLHQSRDLSIAALARAMAGRGHLVFTAQMETHVHKKDLFHRWVYQHVDAAIAITRRIVHQLTAYTPLSPNRIHLLPYGIDLRTYYPNRILQETWREHLGILPDETVVGMVGRIEPGKGIRLFLEAARIVNQRLPNIRFVIIGGETRDYPGYLQEMKNYAEEIGIGDRVVFTGFQPRVHELIHVLDVLVLASRKETFGRVLLEAMACGIPVIGTNAGGVPEIIDHNLNGLLVPPGDVGTLAQAIFRLAGDASKRRRFGQAAREKVEKQYPILVHLEKLENVFQAVLTP